MTSSSSSFRRSSYNLLLLRRWYV